ncbi:hypothetical protein [Peteryoungia algae]|uniref:Phenylacetate-CoA ligase n=1 Tax=Peteryoungia algae TaxID=2919917 RepID=A0ABT0CZW0_9HYPH|nr:hypothetical protein [Rhizobium sp. SSM4.3]MCJ8238705.1 hypothetical protein [Rhizobium sp. SSM4.3]
MDSFKQKIASNAQLLAAPLRLLPNDLRIGKGYSVASRAIRAEGRLSPEAQHQQAFSHLKTIVNFAFSQIPFYRDFYNERAFDPSQLKEPDDWKLVPIVSKEDFQGVSLERRCAQGASGPIANTGGTSGRPLSFRLPEDASGIEWAHMHALWKARGYSPSALKLRIGGTHFASNEAFRYHPRHNELIVNSNCPLSLVSREILRQAGRYCVRWVHGYPSMVAEFAKALVTEDLQGAALFRGRLHGVLLGSEYPAPVYRDAIANGLSANILSWYGHSEMAILAGETAQGVYRSMPTYGFAEAVESGEGRRARLVCSSLHNRTHPFIRYDTGDIVESIATIGATLTFRITEGRIGDYVLDQRNRRLGLTSIIFGRHHSAFDDINHVQVAQRSPGHMTLLIVPRHQDVSISNLASGFDFSGLDLDWNIELVKAPVRSAAGKVKLKLDA